MSPPSPSPSPSPDNNDDDDDDDTSSQGSQESTSSSLDEKKERELLFGTEWVTSEGGGREGDSLSAEDERRLVRVQTWWRGRRVRYRYDRDPYQRKQIFLEMEDAEKHYVKCLEIMVKFYEEPFQESLQSDDPVATEEVVDMLFGGVSVMLKSHREMLENIRAKLPRCGAFSTIGDVFLSIGSFQKSYELFANNHSDAQAYLLEKHPPRLDEFLLSCRMKSKTKYLLDDLLIMPIQRLPRYILLLERLLKITGPSHPDYPKATEALAKVREVASYVDRKTSDGGIRQKLKAIQGMISGACPEIAVANRMFLREGDVTVYSQGDKANRHLFLFNDSVLCVQPLNSGGTLTLRRMFQKSYEYDWMIPLDQITISNVDSQPPEVAVAAPTLAATAGGNFLTSLSSGSPAKLKVKSKSAVAIGGLRSSGSPADQLSAKPVGYFFELKVVSLNDETQSFLMSVEDDETKSEWMKEISTTIQAYLSDPAYKNAPKAGSLRMYNGIGETNLEAISAYKTIHLTTTNSCHLVKSIALDRFLIMEPPAKFNIRVMVEQDENRLLAEDEFPLTVCLEMSKKYPGKLVRMILTRMEEDSTQETKTILRVYHRSQHGLSCKAVLVVLDSTAQDVLLSAMSKYQFLDAPDKYYITFVIAETGAVRRLEPKERINTVKQEMIREHAIGKHGTDSGQFEEADVQCFINMVSNERKAESLRRSVDEEDSAVEEGLTRRMSTGASLKDTISKLARRSRKSFIGTFEESEEANKSNVKTSNATKNSLNAVAPAVPSSSS